MLETIAGIPTIVLGFFAINFLAPDVLKPLFGVDIGVFSALAGGIVVGILVTPLIASISEDAMRAVPRGLREGAYAMGATKFEVVRKVVLPAALSGIMASIILAMSRAVGETMAVVLAAGTIPQLIVQPARERPDDDRVHRPDRPGRDVAGLDPVPVAVRGGDGPVRDHLRAESHQRLVRPSLSDGLLMAADDRSPRAAQPRFEPALMRRKLTGTLFYGACLLAIAILILALIASCSTSSSSAARGSTGTSSPACRHAGRPRPASCPPSSARSSSPSSSRSITFPIGIAAAIYLAEYAPDNRLTRLLQTNISNLAGVPSIIYGIFGLAIFVRLLGFGPVLFSGAATLALVILPLVIIASIEALKAVPQAQREGAYALGASRWQMVRGSVLPAAAPGIMTGIILAMARAIGEAAPLVVVGAATFVTSLPQPLQGGFTVLPIQVFGWAQRPQADFQGIAAAAIIVILVLIFILNLLALVVRARLSRHIQW